MTAELICRDPLLHNVRVEVTGEAPPVRADAEMLQIVFQNLLANPAQAIHGSGTIRVVIGTPAGAARIRVMDQGPGIAPDMRDKIFTPFFTTKARGSGLGLATARRLVEALHGEIDYESPPGQGTTMTVTMPIHHD